ncbi:MAG: cation:proton antiporter [Candidatus Aenigmatarchaeota archaeon]
MTPLVDLALLLFGAKLGGIIFSKLKQPSVLGELIAGITLGPSLLAIVNPSEFIKVVSELGLLFMILLVSLSIDWKRLEGKAEKYSWIEITRIVFVAIIIFGISFVLRWDVYTTTIIGIIAVIASTAIVARTLADTRQLDTPTGQTLMGLEVVDEIVAIISVTIVANLVRGETISIEPIFTILLIVIGLFVVMGRVGFKFVTRITSSIQKYGIEEALFAFTILLAFMLSSLTEGLNLGAMLGVFVAGMLLSRSAQHPIITRKVKEIGESFFIPIFFASVGLTVNMFTAYQEIANVLFVMIILVVVKIITGVIAFRVHDYTTSESLKIASGFLTFSEMSILIAAMAVSKLPNAIYLSIIFSFIIVNVLSPFIINLLFKSEIKFSRRNWS